MADVLWMNEQTSWNCKQESIFDPINHPAWRRSEGHHAWNLNLNQMFPDQRRPKVWYRIDQYGPAFFSSFYALNTLQCTNSARANAPEGAAADQ